MAELSEADVMWPENDNVICRTPTKRSVETQNRRRSGLSSRRRERTEPVSIPPVAAHRPLEESGSESESEEMVPPHVLVSRRWSSASVAFSLSSGPGRVLKGRDLRHVRNSVLRMTGFLES